MFLLKNNKIRERKLKRGDSCWKASLWKSKTAAPPCFSLWFAIKVSLYYRYLVKPCHVFLKESRTANLSTMNNIFAVSAVSAGLPLSSCALLCKPYCKLCNPNFMSSDSTETSQHIVIMNGGHVQGSAQMRVQSRYMFLLYWLIRMQP